jgi:hypothetical protein
MSAAEVVNASIPCKQHILIAHMWLYYEATIAIEQRVSIVKGPFCIGFLCVKMTRL